MPELFDAANTPVDRPQSITLKGVIKTIRSHFLTKWIGITSVILLIASSLRHWMLQSTAFDLGIYDQVAYLLSRGMAPISSYLGFHHMGNHTAYSFYLMAIPYWIYPSVYWLFGVQAVCLALGAFPTWLLARQAGLSAALSSAMAAVYLLHPLIFNVNMFDFHPEVMALPVLLLALWLARSNQKLWFCLAVLFVLGCKDALSVTIATMGVWLIVFEKRRFYGAFALICGITWFFLATQWIIPALSGNEAAALGRYQEVLGGDSVLEVALNLFRKPGIVLGKIFSGDTLQYLALLFVPFIWGLSPRYMAPMLSVVPIILLNILSKNDGQRDLVHQYSLPVLPFLLLSVIDSLAHGRGLIRQRRWIIVWMLIIFLMLGKYSRYWQGYTSHLSTWHTSREALALIPPYEGKVIADNYHAAHLSHRSEITLLRRRNFKEDYADVDYVLMNMIHPWNDDYEKAALIFERVKRLKFLEVTYQNNGIYLFTRKPPTRKQS